MCELSEYGALFLCTPMKPALIQGSVTIKIDHGVLGLRQMGSQQRCLNYLTYIIRNITRIGKKMIYVNNCSEKIIITHPTFRLEPVLRPRNIQSKERLSPLEQRLHKASIEAEID